MLCVHNVFLDNTPVVITTEGRHIARIEPVLPGAPLSAPDGATILDGEGGVVLPAFTDAHMHLDKTRLGFPWTPHAGGATVASKVAAERRLRQELGHDPARGADALIRLALSQGTTRIRSHVDIDPVTTTAYLEALLVLREVWKDYVTIELVAFPQSGIMGEPAVPRLLEEAMRAGADIVGGLDPVIVDNDPKGHLDFVFSLAERHGAPIDIHLHEPGEVGAFSLRAIMARTKALGMQGRVAVSHAFALGGVAEPVRAELAAELASLGIGIISSATPSAMVPPVLPLLDAGVPYALGSDTVQDFWNPFGNASMLERVMLMCLRMNLRRDAEITRVLALATCQDERIMAASAPSVAQGQVAEFTVIPAASTIQAVTFHPAPTLVIAQGRLAARNGHCLV